MTLTFMGFLLRPGEDVREEYFETRGGDHPCHIWHNSHKIITRDIILKALAPVALLCVVRMTMTVVSLHLGPTTTPFQTIICTPSLLILKNNNQDVSSTEVLCKFILVIYRSK